MHQRLTQMAIILIAAALSIASPGCGARIDAVSPVTGYPGDIVHLFGSGFGETQEDSAVTFGGTGAGEAISWSDREIVIAVPEDARCGHVVVTVGGLPSNGAYFMVYADCELFAGGDFKLDIVDAGDTCFDSPLSELVAQALAGIDIRLLPPVEVPPTADLPIELEMEFPGAGLMTYRIDAGSEKCWEGSLVEPHDPFLLDFGELTGGEFDCSILIGDVDYRMDPLADDALILRLALQIDAIEGEMCPPNHAPNCVIATLFKGTLVGHQRPLSGNADPAP